MGKVLCEIARPRSAVTSGRYPAGRDKDLQRCVQKAVGRPANSAVDWKSALIYQSSAGMWHSDSIRDNYPHLN